jgi:O-acetylserine/cysteine efflux transporter
VAAVLAILYIAPVRPLDLLRTLAVMLIWGLNFIVAKWGLAEFPPLLMMGLRFGLVALLLCPWNRLSPRLLVHVLPLSLTLGSVHFSLMFGGLARIDAALAALLVPVQVPIAAALAALVFRERITVRLALGLVIAFVGTALIAGEPRASDPVPVAMILGASLVWAIANMQLKFVAGADPYALTGWIAFFAAPQLLALSLLFEHEHWRVLVEASWRGWASTVYQAVAVAILSYAIWYRLIRIYPVNQLMPFTLLAPVIAVAGAALLLGEDLSLRLVVGGLATMAGVAVTVVRLRKA